MLTKIDDLEFMSKDNIGEGAYSKVYHVKHKSNKKEYALKHVSLMRLIFSKSVKKIVKT